VQYISQLYLEKNIASIDTSHFAVNSMIVTMLRYMRYFFILENDKNISALQYGCVIVHQNIPPLFYIGNIALIATF
jgi:hypothetical protein